MTDHAPLPTPYVDEHRHDHGGAHMHDQRRVRRLLFAFALTGVTLVAEAVGGLLSGSLALLADAGHMLVDALALLFAWLGALLARRPADARRSFGYARLEVLVGYSNALAQFMLVAWIAFEAVQRVMQPAPILSGLMLAVAVVGLLVNVVVLRVLGGHHHDDVNTAAARLHVIGDLLGSIGAVGAALLVRYFDWLWADPAISIVVSMLILRSAWSLLRRTAHILLEGVPDGIDGDGVAALLNAEAAGVHDVHHVHVWQLAGGSRMATLHAQLDVDVSPDTGIRTIRRVLHERFAIDHVTVQLDGIGCVDKACDKPHGVVGAGDPHAHSHHDHSH
jgi:cobalt-zinc-cadmium efflux system protein